MNPIERLTLTAAFIAAAVVAGLSLSLVPNVELVTLVVFAAGVALGARRGVWIGASAMVLYVLANSAVRGFPPSPLPVLAAQAAGMSLAGLGGAVWRRLFLPGGRLRRWSLHVLPVFGIGLTTCNQVLLNLVYARLYAVESEAFLKTFWSGLAFGAVQIVSNGLLFALAGPGLTLTLRRLGRERGWWKPLLGALLGILVFAPGTWADPARDDGSESAVIDTVAVDRDSTEVEPDWFPASTTQYGPLWRSVSRAATATGAAWSHDVVLHARAPALASHPGAATGWDRFALGWGRSRFTYDGVPTDGPIHAFAEPPDLPISWRGGATEKFTATGTHIDRAAAPDQVGRPLSEVSLTTGSLGRRTTEVSLHRSLRSVNLAVDFADREFGPSFDVSDVDATRLWIRLESAPRRRPDWSLDLSDGTSEHKLFGGSRLALNTRRLQASLSGPTLGGPTRIALQLRRQAVKSAAGGVSQAELLWDGFTLQGDWEPPFVRGLEVGVRLERDRRRGVLEQEETLDGARVVFVWTRSWSSWSVSGEAAAGHQEPFGGTWEAALATAYERPGFRAAVSVARQEGVPALTGPVDRAAPEFGLTEYLETIETLDEPERTHAVRLETAWTGGLGEVRIGAWAAHQENYLIENNPVWAAAGFSPYAPLTAPPRRVDILGVYGGGRLGLGRGFSASGRGHVHDRSLSDVPYLPQWVVSGDLHFRRRWFGSLDLDIALGGDVFGERSNPEGFIYPATPVGHLRLTGIVGTGVVVFAVENLADTAAEASFRSEDAVSALPVSGRQFIFGLTMRLFD